MNGKERSARGDFMTAEPFATAAEPLRNASARASYRALPEFPHVTP
jgi:hypothetical protein